MGTESEIGKRALELFDECTKILNGEFRDKEMFWLAFQRCKKIMELLENLGFDIVMERRSLNRKKMTLLREELEILEISYTLKLVPGSGKDNPHVSISHPTSKVYTGVLPLPKDDQLNNELSPEDIKWMQENGLRPWTEDQEKWHFTPEQRHALLVALKRHWKKLKINAEERNVFLDRYETWERIIKQAQEVWPSQNENDRYILCFLIEYELKFLKTVREILRKNGGAVLNVCSDPNCSTSQHVKYIAALENWLDENLKSKC